MSFLDWLERSRVRYGLALGEAFLLAARSNNRRDDFIESSRVEIPPELLSVSIIEPNIRGVSKFAQLAGEALDRVGGSGKSVALVLPDMAVRAFVLPKGVKATRAEMLTRIAPRLSYPEREVRFDTWSSPYGTVVAAVRQAVLRQYEQALEALGCRVAWVDSASLIGIPDWVGSDRPSDSSDGSDRIRILVQLYPRHYTLSVLGRGEMFDIRTKLRSSGDESRIAEQLTRLPMMFDGAQFPEVTLQGVSAGVLARELEAAGFGREQIHIGDEGEETHLGRALGLLLQRS
jgi:hypothetical protein